MARQTGWWVLAIASLLVVGAVLGVAAKVGRDTSKYLQTVSAQRDWQRPGEGSADVGAADAEGGAGTPAVALGAEHPPAAR